MGKAQREALEIEQRALEEKRERNEKAIRDAKSAKSRGMAALQKER